MSLDEQPAPHSRQRPQQQQSSEPDFQVKYPIVSRYFDQSIPVELIEVSPSEIRDNKYSEDISKFTNYYNYKLSINENVFNAAAPPYQAAINEKCSLISSRLRVD